MKIATRRGNTWETNTLDEEYPNSLIRSYTRVSELIDTETNTWDEELIREIFWSVDAERILHIPLAVGMTEDFVS